MANVSDELLQLRKRARRRLIGAIALVIFALTFLWTVLDGEPPKNLVDNHAVEIISSAPALSSTVASAEAASAVVQLAPLEPAPIAELPIIEASKIAPVALPGKLITHQTERVATPTEQAVATIETAATELPPVPTPVKVATPKPTSVKKPTEKVVVTPEPKKVVAVNPADILEGKKPSAAVTTAPSAKKVFLIQVGAYADAEKAAQLVSKLRNTGLKVRSETITTSKGELTRVRVGPTDDEAKAKAWIRKMQEVGVSGTLIAKAAQ